MIDVTKIILNFQNFLIALLKAFNFTGIERGSDDWDNLTEDIFDILVSQFIERKYNFSINCQYEVWGKDSTKNSLLVKIPSNSKILLAKKMLLADENTYEKNLHMYQEILSTKNDIEFHFVEFGSPMYDENDLLSLNYVSGITENGEIICANIDDCQFFIANNRPNKEN